MLVHTSGSTGKPKPMWVEKKRMAHSARTTCAFLGLKRGDTALLCLSLNYIAGKMMAVRAIEWGLNLVCVEPSGHPLSTINVELSSQELKGVKGSQKPLASGANNLSSESPSLREGLGVGSSTKFSWSSLDTDTIAKLPKSELPADVDAIPASDYLPVKITTKSGRKIQPSKSIKTSEPLVTTWTITPGLGKEYALRFRYKNVTGEPVKAQLKIVDSKKAVLVDREVSFPPTPKKFKMLSTTTGTQINAGTYTLTIEAKDLEFEKLTVQ